MEVAEKARHEAEERLKAKTAEEAEAEPTAEAEAKVCLAILLLKPTALFAQVNP